MDMMIDRVRFTAAADFSSSNGLTFSAAILTPIDLGTVIKAFAQDVTQSIGLPDFMSSAVLDVKLLRLSVFFHLNKAQPMFALSAVLQLYGQEVPIDLIVAKINAKWEVLFSLTIGQDTLGKLSGNLLSDGFTPVTPALIICSAQPTDLAKLPNLSPAVTKALAKLKPGLTITGSVVFDHGVLQSIGDVLHVKDLTIVLTISARAWRFLYSKRFRDCHRSEDSADQLHRVRRLQQA